MLLQNDNVNDGNYFVEMSRIYDDALVDKVVSHVSHSDAEYYIPRLEIGFFEEHSVLVPGDVILDYRQLMGGFPLLNEYHFVLDEEWYNKYYGEDSNKVLRTLATGQSDITRHEAHTKAQGLNWSNANVPKYSAEATYNVLLTIGENSLSIPVSILGADDNGAYYVGTIQGSIRLDTGNTISISNLPLTYEYVGNSSNGIQIQGIMNSYPYGSADWNTGSNDVVIGNTYSATYNESTSNISVTKLRFEMTNKAEEDE